MRRLFGILTDDRLVSYPDCINKRSVLKIVRTLWKTGFTPEDAKKAIEILNADAENL